MENYKIKSLKKYFTIDEAAKYLGLSKSALRTMVARRQIEFLKLGNRIRFELKTLDESFVRYNSVDSL